jgi:hypothetical protein
MGLYLKLHNYLFAVVHHLPFWVICLKQKHFWLVFDLHNYNLSQDFGYPDWAFM